MGVASFEHDSIKHHVTLICYQVVVSCGPAGGCRRHGGGKGVAGVVVTVLLEDIVAEVVDNATSTRG